jgi:hypothetical protein
MARTKNPIWRQVSGAIAGQIVYKQYYDKTVISAMPDMSKRKLSEKQKEWNRRMSIATAYAQWVCETEERKVLARVRFKIPAHKAVFQAMVQAHLNKFKHSPLGELDATDTELDFPETRL